MQWVKASERTPGNTWERFFCHVENIDGVISNAIVTWQYNRWLYDYYGQYKVIEWIDESPSNQYELWKAVIDIVDEQSRTSEGYSTVIDCLKKEFVITKKS